MTSTLYLCGAGNPEGVRLALRINQAGCRWERIVLVDDDPAKHGQQILGIEIVGSFDTLADADPDTSEAANLVARTTARRRAAQQRIDGFRVQMTRLIDPSVDTLGVEFGRDITVYQGAIFSANAFIDDTSVVFARAVVGHGCRTGKYCVLAPGAVLNARVELEDGVYVGTNASVNPDLRIGAGATIGANSSVVQDVPAGASVIGVPGEILLTSRGQAATPPAGETAADSTFAVGRDPDMQRHYEELIAATWQEVLQLSRVDVDANLFEIGGTSLLAVQLCQKISQATSSRMSLTDIYRFPTVRTLAQHLARETSGRPAPTPGEKRARLRHEILSRRYEIHHRV